MYVAICEYAVFDDMMHGLYSIPNWKFWLGGQSEFAVGDKYMRKQRIIWGKPCIFIGNNDPRLSLVADEVTWLEKNCVFCEITSDLVVFPM